MREDVTQVRYDDSIIVDIRGDTGKKYVDNENHLTEDW